MPKIYLFHVTKPKMKCLVLSRYPLFRPSLSDVWELIKNCSAVLKITLFPQIAEIHDAHKKNFEEE